MTNFELLAHYISLAKQPGWRDYVLHRVKTLAAEPHGLYADFKERLVAAMQEQGNDRDRH